MYNTPVSTRSMYLKQQSILIQYQYFPKPVINFHDDPVIHPMAEIGEMANHGASTAAMVNIVDEKGDETKKITLDGKSYR